MNAQLLENARNAYRAGDFAQAAQLFAAAKQPGEAAGEADHLRGNSLMRLGLFRDAAIAYGEALADASYGRRGALLTNQGKAYAASGDFASAQASFQAATQDASYATPYKAYLGLGDALLESGDPTNAGVAFRQAAIDGTNPAPALALAKLGACFLKIGRAQDAAESYRTAVDYAGPQDDTRSIQAGLGQALAACGRPQDAVDAFQRATSDGLYQLTAEEAASFQSAQDALSTSRSMAPVADAPLTPAVDPLDPLGKSGQFMPDPSDTGFFTLSESEMIQQDKVQQKVRRKHNHTGLKLFLTIFVLLVIVAGGLAFAYTRGFGYPSQQSSLTGLFTAVTDGSSTDEYLASGLSDDAKAVITSTIPQGATPAIEGMDQSMTESTATVKVTLSKGGTQTYEVGFVREGLGWRVSSVTVDLSGNGSDATGTTTNSTKTDTGSAATDASAADTAATDGASSTDTAATTDGTAATTGTSN